MPAVDSDLGRFNYRAAAVILRTNAVLLHRLETDDFWSVPGGRVEFGETSETTLRRELVEEIGVEAYVDRLLWIAESFFGNDEGRWHELALYHLVTLPEGCHALELDRFNGDEEGKPLIFEWLPLDKLAATRIYPLFLQQALTQIPEQPVHVVDDRRAVEWPGFAAELDGKRNR